MKHYLKLLRVHHYIKNLLIFTALVCSGQLFNTGKLIHGIIGFCVFCMASSVVYIINDIFDKEKDRLHTTKCNRPIAAGIISVKKAWVIVAALLFLTILSNSVIYSHFSTVLLICYMVLNLAYSFGLKNVPLLDVTILVSGFLIRILYGAFITNITISNWLYLTVMAMAFYFALGKRRNELKQMGETETRQVLKYYPVSFLTQSMYVCLTLANVFYALWSMDKSTTRFYNNKYLVLTFPIVLLISMKYSLDVEGNYDGDPVEVLVHDKALMVLSIVYLLLMFLILYF